MKKVGLARTISSNCKENPFSLSVFHDGKAVHLHTWRTDSVNFVTERLGCGLVFVAFETFNDHLQNTEVILV